MSFLLPTCNLYCDLWPNSTCSPAVFKRSGRCHDSIRGVWDVKLIQQDDSEENGSQEIGLEATCSFNGTFAILDTAPLYCSSYRIQLTLLSRWMETWRTTLRPAAVLWRVCKLPAASDSWALQPLWARRNTRCDTRAVTDVFFFVFFLVRIRTTRCQQNEQYNLPKLWQKWTIGVWVIVLFGFCFLWRASKVRCSWRTPYLHLNIIIFFLPSKKGKIQVGQMGFFLHHGCLNLP